VQIGRVGFSGIKGYDYSLTPCIYPDVAHSRDAHERFAQFADAFIAILAFCRDRDSLQYRFVWAVRIMRVGWIEMLRIEGLDHWSIYAPSAALSSRAERGTSPMVCNIRISNSYRRQSLLTRDISVRLSVAQVCVILSRKVGSLASLGMTAKKPRSVISSPLPA
jgi:hypothetical protein